MHDTHSGHRAGLDEGAQRRKRALPARILWAEVDEDDDMRPARE
jgi:hypothetical protein